MGRFLFTTETQRQRGKAPIKRDSWRMRPWIRVHYLHRFSLCLCISVVIFLAGCSKKPDPHTLVMIIESSPTNLDPRVGVDAQSQRIDELLFDPLVRSDSHFNVQPWLAESWEIPDPLTYIFHLRSGVRFQNGQPLTARDVKWTFDSLTGGEIRSATRARRECGPRPELP